MKFYLNYNSKKEGLPTLGKFEELCADGGIPMPRDFDINFLPDDKILVAVEHFNSFDVAYVVTYEERKLIDRYNPPVKFLMMDKEPVLSNTGLNDYLEP